MDTASPKVDTTPLRVGTSTPRVRRPSMIQNSESPLVTKQAVLPFVEYDPSELDKSSNVREPWIIPTRQNGTHFKGIATKTLLAQHLFDPYMHHLFNSNGHKEILDYVLKEDKSATWTKHLSNEIGCLAQGNDHGVTPTDIMDFIQKHGVPQGRDITYANIILYYCPLKQEKY